MKYLSGVIGPTYSRSCLKTDAPLFYWGKSMTNVPEQFKKIVESFYGSTAGNIRSPIWFCGLEWGGGYDESIPIFVDNLEPYDFKSLHVWSAKQFESYFWTPRSAFCRNVIKLLYGLKKGPCSGWSSKYEEWDKDGIAGPNGIAMILNAYPISFKDRNQAYQVWDKLKVRFADGHQDLFKSWTGLKTFRDYKSYVLDNRSEVFINERKKRAPKLIIAFGYENYQRLWGADKGSWDEADFKFSSKPGKKADDCFGYWLNNGEGKEKTLLLITPFPSGSHGLVSDEQMDAVIKWLDVQLGKNWLEQALEKLPNSRLDRFSDIGDDSNGFIFKGEGLIKKICHFKELTNQQLTCLENIEDYLEEFGADSVSINDLKEKITHHLVELDGLAIKAKRFRDEERQAAWQDVELMAR